MAAEAHAPTASEYIVHHLQHLAERPQTKIVDFSVINYRLHHCGALLGFHWLVDFVVWLRARPLPVFRGASRRLWKSWWKWWTTRPRPTSTTLRAASSLLRWALTVFVWIFLMNFMDMLPVDLLPAIWTKIYGAMGHDPHHAYLRVVPTADLSTTLGLAFPVLLLRFWYSVKIKGAGGWAHELVSHLSATSKNPDLRPDSGSHQRADADH
jgi:F-type H+-transporting ATPase subunit a